VEERSALQKSIGRTHISTARRDEAAHKTGEFQKERQKYRPMRYKSFLTQYVAVGHSISQSSFTYFIFSVAQVGLPGVFLHFPPFCTIPCSLETFKVHEVEENNTELHAPK
jgi:hypothetical protein